MGKCFENRQKFQQNSANLWTVTWNQWCSYKALLDQIPSKMARQSLSGVFFLIITLSKHDFSDNEEAILTTSTSQWVDELEEKPEINEFGQISSSQNFLPSASNSLELTNLGQEIQQSQDNQFPSSWYSYPYQNGTRDSFSNSLLSFNETSNPVSIS